MNAASSSSSSGVRSTGQMMVDRTPVYDKVFKRKPKAGRPRKKDAQNRQYWLR